MLIGLLSTKALSLILGPAGLGELRLFQSLLISASYFAGLGMGSSAVRDIAAASEAGKQEEVCRLVWLYRRVNILLGFVGALALVALAAPISTWVFDEDNRSGTVAWLAVALFFSAIQSGQMVPLQALQRIGTTAKVLLLTSAWSVPFTIAVMWIWGIDATALAIGGSAFGSLVAARLLAPRAGLTGSADHRFSIRQAWDWCRLGIATMAVDTLGSLVVVAISAAIVHQLGMESNGLYLAAWGLSGVFASLVLGAMVGDLYPRLAAARGDSAAMSRLVGEQMEISVLLSLPGLFMILGLAPVAVRIFYSREFASAADLILWFVPFVFCRVLITPISYALLASGRGGSLLVVQATYLLAQVALAIVGLKWRGLVGLAEGTCVAGLFGLVVFTLGARQVVGFRWSTSATRIARAGGAGIAICVMIAALAPGELSRGAVCSILSLLALIATCRGLVLRLGDDHRLVRYMRVIPVLRSLVGLR
jgi:PST family polysaccharide transporter